MYTLAEIHLMKYRMNKMKSHSCLCAVLLFNSWWCVHQQKHTESHFKSNRSLCLFSIMKSGNLSHPYYTPKQSNLYLYETFYIYILIHLMVLFANHENIIVNNNTPPQPWGKKYWQLNASQTDFALTGCVQQSCTMTNDIFILSISIGPDSSSPSSHSTFHSSSSSSSWTSL